MRTEPPPSEPMAKGDTPQATEASIADVLRVMPLDILQIYGSLDQLPAIRARFGLPIWRAVGVSGSSDLPAEALGADLLLLEAKPPAGSNRPGGNAASFDWTVLRGWTAPAPWMLAGGLTPENVATAIRQTGAMSVDVSSGVESSKGVKDPARIRAFIAAAKGADREPEIDQQI